MSFSSVLEAILENTPIAVLLIGVILLVLGAAGGIPSLQLHIDELGWRIAIGAMGAVVAAFGGLVIWRGNTPTAVDRPARGKNYGIKVVSPDKNRATLVNRSFEISGTYDREIPANALQIYVVDDRSQPSDAQYWPIMRPGEYSAARGQWRASVYIGGDLGPRTITVAVGGRVAQALYAYYWRVGSQEDRETGKHTWVSIDKRPVDLVECDRVNVVPQENP